MFQFEDIWKLSKDSIKGELSIFMRDHFTAARGATHLADAATIARDEQGKIAAFSTAHLLRVPRLNDNWLFEYKSFVSPPASLGSMPMQLALITFDTLAKFSITQKTKPVGILVDESQSVIMTDPSLIKKARWTGIDLYFIGFTEGNHRLRVHYFKNARI